MALRDFRPGGLVQVLRDDPVYHSRVPRYIRGAVGTLVEQIGEHPLPDDRVRGIPTVEPVWTVRFHALNLFGNGSHEVTVDVWESRMDPL